MSLRNLSLKTSYHKGEDDIAGEFFVPCLSRSKRYDRAVGFFSSSVYVVAWSGLRAFVSNGGRMRLLCSHILSGSDIDALSEGYSSRIEETTSQALTNQLDQLLSNQDLVLPTRLLAALVRARIVDLKVAILVNTTPAASRRMFHDKLGLLSDSAGDVVAFKGSMNESWNGLSNEGNLESVDVMLSWVGGREAERVERESGYFDRLWRGDYPGLLVRPFPEVPKEELVRSSDGDDWESILDRLEAKGRTDHIGAASEPGTGVRFPPQPLRKHQAAALANWHAAGRRGIFQHATGSGKTFTALVAIHDSLLRDEIPVVLVPSRLLLQQWVAALKSTLQHFRPRILLCGAGNSRWSTNSLLRHWSRPGDAAKRILVATMRTASTERFRTALVQGAHLFLVADEVHRIGSHQNLVLLSLDTGPRLGLSATPHRAGDAEGTGRLLEYFHGICPPTYTISQAISERVLCPYFYRVHCVALDTEEMAEWRRLSKSIVRALNREDDSAERVRLLRVQRARIGKKARQKTQAAVSVLEAAYEDGQRWIVYCEDTSQLHDVAQLLKARGMQPLVYYSSMEDDEAATLDWFTDIGGVVVAIRCLDEGVDIPAVSHALILASSTNPREYVQRRGRVLRKAPGKALAFIHDVVVTPPEDEDSAQTPSFLRSELARCLEFGRNAENPSAIADIEHLALTWGLDIGTLAAEGEEIDG